ncbi:MAG: outer membrane beta-barrel protein [Deltaproteobacteria bacterium]|nr:outer membrane beta-barrel protein [Deltaproteobacteria bacterium]
MIACRRVLVFLVVMTVITGMCGPPPARGAGRIEITPMVTVGTVYDDNIFLDKDNEKSDYITTISPGIGLAASSRDNGMDLFYAPTFVKYHDYSDNDTVRHNARLHLWQEIGKSWRFDVRENYLRSEEAAESSFADYEERERTRHTRNTYERNVLDGAVRYQFGPEDTLTAGYRHDLLENKDPSLDDVTQHGPYAGLVYWFDKHNGMDLRYRFTRASFERNDGNPAGDDFDGHEADARYLYRWNQRTRGYVGYGYTRRDFEKASREDRTVHEGSVGLTHGFSPRTSVSLDAGYYKPEGYGTDETGHMSYGATLTRAFERGTLSLRGTSGWDEDYLDAEDQRGYTRYWSVAGDVDYRVSKNVTAYAGGSYRKNEPYLSNVEDRTYMGRCGLRTGFFRWYSLSLEYTYLNRRSDDPDDEYVDNRIMLMLSASRPFRSVY